MNYAKLYDDKEYAREESNGRKWDLSRYSIDVLEQANYSYPSVYVSDWRQLTGYYINFVPQYYADQVTQDNAYELLKNDESVFHALNIYSLFAAGEDFKINCYNDVVRELVQRGLSHIYRFTHARKSLAYGSYLFGMGLQKKYWKKVKIRGFPGVWEVPYKICEVDRRRLRIEKDYNDLADGYWTIYDPRFDTYVKMKDRNEFPDYEVAVQDYVWSWWEQEEINPYYRGAGEVLYRMVHIRNKLMQYYPDLCEKWGQPIVIGLINTLRGSFDIDGEDGLKSHTARAQEMLDNWEKMRARNTFLLDKDGDRLEFKEHGGVGLNLLQELLNYCDKKIHQIILGAELVTESGGGGGSYALSQSHEGVMNSIVKFGRGNLESDYKNDLVMEFLHRNKFGIMAMGEDVPFENDIDIEFVVKREELKEQVLKEVTSESDAKKIVNTI